ncbi:hypothetical protein OAO62_04785 [Gammaproteobacteria bacterium]|nr:hypothetical protein [Gammaproteobacteria bacterium]
MLSQKELEATYLKIYLRALKLTPEELEELKKKGHRYEHLKPVTVNKETTEDKLRKLKDLYDEELISKEVYEKQQLEILSE